MKPDRHFKESCHPASWPTSVTADDKAVLADQNRFLDAMLQNGTRQLDGARIIDGDCVVDVAVLRCWVDAKGQMASTTFEGLRLIKRRSPAKRSSWSF